MRRISGAALAFFVLTAAAADARSAADATSAGVPIPALVNATPLSTGDFDGDGQDDLAVGVPREDAGTRVDAGAVSVLYGTSTGLSAARNQFWTQGSPGVPGALEPNDGFGWATAAGDFDGDGYDDLAIGAPLETISFEKRTTNGCCIVVSLGQAGAVNVLYGSPGGLVAARAQLWHQRTSGIKGEAERGDFFGAALAAGDFDGDGRDELAIGIPGENEGAGAVQILTGKRTGLSASDQLWLQDTQDVEDTSERGDAFGSVLAAGNLGYSGREEDLAIGIPGEDVGAEADAGAVAVLYGQPGKGLNASLVPDRLLHQDVDAADDVAEKRDMFGAALAIGDFGRTAQGDLAVGVPGETLTVARQGVVQVFYGSSFGVSAADNQVWSAGSGAGALGGEVHAAAEFGRSLAAADVNGFSQADLAIGSPYARIDGIPGAGSVHVVFGGASGLTVTGSAAVPAQLWRRKPVTGGGQFGFALAGGEFGGSPVGERLAVGEPNAVAARGLVHVVSREGLVGPSWQIWHQGNPPGILDSWQSGDRFGGG